MSIQQILLGLGAGPSGPSEVSATLAMFGGGGSGGGWLGAGGGGGGYLEINKTLQIDLAYPFQIGAAGATPAPGPTPPGANRGNPGGNTTFELLNPSGTPQTYTAYGGGGGGAIAPTVVSNRRGRPGGSGGGGFDPSSPPGAGLGNRVGGPPDSTTVANTPPANPEPVNVQGYDGGNGAFGDGMAPGGGGAGGAGSNASNSKGGDGGAAVTTTNFGPYNGTYGGGGGGAATHGKPGGTGAGDAGDGVMTNQSAKNAGGRANGGGGVREGGHPGGTGTAGIALFRVPDAFDTTITNGGSSQVVTGGYRYVKLTSPGTIKFINS